MSRVTTILLVLFAVAAIVFLAIYEPLTRSTRELAWTDREGLVLQLDPASVDEIHIVSGDERIELKRRGKGWQLGPPSPDRADNALVEKFLAAAAGISFFDRIDGRDLRDDNALGEYGLRRPKRKIEFKGDRPVTLFLGKDGANEKRLYARTDRSRDVFLIDDEILDLAFRMPADFRDRRLTDVAPGQVDRVFVRRESGELELQRDASGWRIVKPLHAPADEAGVEGFLNRLLGLRITDFAAEDSGDLSIYGINEGRDEITFLAEGSDKRQTLRFGTDRNGVLFGQFTARNSVYRLPAGARELLAVTPDLLRDRRLLPVNLDMVDLIRVRAAQGAFTLRRNDSGWELVQEGGDPRPASPEVIRTLADALARTTASAYTPAVDGDLSAFRLVPPSRSVEFVSVLSENTPESRVGEQVIASVVFGAPANGTVFARVSDAPEVATVPDSVLAAIPADPAAWLAPRPAKTP